MALNEILKLGDKRLLEVSSEVDRIEVNELYPHLGKMWRLISEFRSAYGRGRAIAAPQTGLMKRIICLNINEPIVMFNPQIIFKSSEMIEIWDDCMSFPSLLVLVERHREIKVAFKNMNWEEVEWDLKDDLSELIQHEYDHLDGILAISRAKNIECFRWTD